MRGRSFVMNIPMVGAAMYDERKVDDVILALLHLNAFKDGGGWRAWKGFDWDALDRLYERGLISNPKSKAKSVVLRRKERASHRSCSRPTSAPAMSNQRCVQRDADSVLAGLAAPGDMGCP